MADESDRLRLKRASPGFNVMGADDKRERRKAAIATDRLHMAARAGARVLIAPSVGAVLYGRTVISAAMSNRAGLRSGCRHRIAVARVAKSFLQASLNSTRKFSLP